jgi:hypothetical protein
MNMQREFLLLVTLAAAAATPAVGQTVVAAAGAASTQGAASIPDFAGIWWHPSLPGFEPPASGPRPVTNRSNPILKPETADIVRKFGELSLRGVTFPSPANQCWPEPVPYIYKNFGIQIFQQPDRITIVYDQDHEVRHVRMNQPHPAPVMPSWYGDSVGHYEGDTLVIDTVGIKIGPFAMVDMYGTPHSPALHVVERYRLLDYADAKDAMARNAKENSRTPGADFDAGYRGKVLQLHFTVEDEAVFTMPWTATITYRPAVGAWTDLICSENIHEYYGGKDAAVPQADKPDF